jgi:hypothetical protein
VVPAKGKWPEWVAAGGMILLLSVVVSNGSLSEIAETLDRV